MPKKHVEEDDLTPVEITPSEEYHERPMWQRIAAWILIALIVAATVACAFWKFI